VCGDFRCMIKSEVFMILNVGNCSCEVVWCKKGRKFLLEQGNSEIWIRENFDCCWEMLWDVAVMWRVGILDKVFVLRHWDIKISFLHFLCYDWNCEYKKIWNGGFGIEEFKYMSYRDSEIWDYINWVVIKLWSFKSLVIWLLYLKRLENSCCFEIEDFGLFY
jgi:hypothetical protein